MQKTQHYRKCRGLNQKQLSQLAGVTQATVSHYERNRRITPKPETAYRLAKVLGIDFMSYVLPNQAEIDQDLAERQEQFVYQEEKHGGS